MKKIVSLAAAMLLCVCAFAQSGKSLYQKYSDSEGVSAVYVSPAMFRMIGKIPDIDAGGGDVNLAPVIRSLSGMYLIESSNPSVSSRLYSDANRLLSSGSFEMLMEAKDNGSRVHIYTAGNESVVTSFVLVAEEGDSLTFIWLDGQMDRGELENLLSEKIVVE